MKISNIFARQPPTPGAPTDWRTQLGQILVEVQTDAGLAGIGVGGGGAAGVHVVQTVLRDLLVGRDAAKVEELHRDMCRHTAFYGRKGLAVMAISGVDLALWDLRGKAAQQPLAKLLNPSVHLQQAIPTYSTVFDDREAQAAIAQGRTAVKLHVERFGSRPDPREIAELVKRTRAALGDAAMIMIDAFARWDVTTTLRVAEQIAPYHVEWLEEPLPPDDLAGYAELAASSPVPIAGGEHEYLVEGFSVLIDRRLHAVLQPDINWCGGLTTLVEVYRLAQAAGLRVCPHRGSEPYALHAIAALDNHPLAESPRTWFDCLQGAPQIENGVVRLREAAGFGIEVSPEFPFSDL